VHTAARVAAYIDEPTYAGADQPPTEFVTPILTMTNGEQ
jgi:hypothetical protein